MDSDYLYENKLPFTAGKREDGMDVLAYNLDMLLVRREKKKPTIIVIDGMSGEGKTTMSVHVCDYLQKRQIKFEEHIFMGGKKFMKGLLICYEKKLVVALYTEAGDFGKKATLTKLNRTLDLVFETFRTYNIIVVIDLPFMPKLDGGIFEKGIPRLLIHCYGRKNTGKFSAYDTERMLWLRHRAGDKGIVNKQKIYEMVQPNFRGHFKDLEPGRSKELDKFCTSGKSEILHIAEISGEGLLTYPEIARKLNRSVEWVRRKASAMRVEAVKVYKGKKYYHESAVDILKGVKGK